MTVKRLTCSFPILLTLVLGISLSARAQDSAAATASPVDSTHVLQELLELKRNEHASMERMLAALNSVDSVYKVHYPSWIVLDDDLRERVHKTFRMRYANVPRDVPVTVVANADANEILEISVGTAVMGRRDAHINLSDSLHKELLGGLYARQIISKAPVKNRTFALFGSVPRFAAITASAFGAVLLLSDGKGIEAKLGHEEIGYHFWSTGDFRVMAILDQLKVGVMIPFRYGNNQASTVGPLTIRPRRLSGSRGVAAEYCHPWDQHSLSARFSVGEITEIGTPELYVDLNRSYYLHTVGQLFYSRELAFGGTKHLFTLSGGLGFHQIALAETELSGKVTASEKNNFLSPLAKIDYIHQGSTLYGIGLQYYSGIFHFKGWLEVIKNFIFLDLQYYSPVLRETKPWEQSYFFMISPRIQVMY